MSASVSPPATKNNAPIDREWLDSWIQPQHLKIENISSYREEITFHPARLLILENFLLDAVIDKISEFINHEAVVETIYGLYSQMENDPDGLANVSAAEWKKAAEKDRFFRLRKFVRLSPEKQLTDNLAMYLHFLSAFNDPRFRRFFEAVTGLKFSFEEATYHLFTYKKGDFLGVHTDRTKNYLLAFILYLSPDWEARFGGDLHVIQPDGEDVLKIAPNYNSIVLFNVEAQRAHYVSPIKDCAAERGRSTFSGWLHKAF